MIHCPKCDALFEAHDDARPDTACPRCGCIVRKAAATGAALKTPDRNGAVATDHIADFGVMGHSGGSGFSLSGRPGILHWTKNVAVRLTRSVCPGCRHQVARGMCTCPNCGRTLRKSSPPAPREFGSVLRKMLVAATVFIGFPAAVIVFVLVVCAPEEGDVGANAPRTAPAAPVAQRATAPSAERHRSPFSMLRSIRAWLHGAEHDSGSSPAKAPLEKPGDGVSDPHVPPVGTRNGEQVKPDPTR
jgi:hypothetical protein